MAKKSFNTRQIMAGFGVSDMTVFTWRKGTATKSPIPHVIEGRNVTFAASEVKAWAKAHGLNFDVAKAEAVADTEKPGPKSEPAAKASTKAPEPAKKRSRSAKAEATVAA